MSDANELISFIASMSGEGNLRVEENLGEGYVRLRVSEAERRQAKHDIQHVEDIVIEMLRNARDAGADKVYLATTMALFSIKQNTDEARVVTSGVDLGSAFKVSVAADRLSERADQSSWPQAVKDEDGRYVCARGPHNIIRAACEFALEELRGCDVYLGSPSEIAATLYAQASSRLDTSRLLFIDDESELPVVDRLGLASDAEDFIRICSGLGLEMSERTAHRILAGQIKPVRGVTARLLRERDSSSHAPAPVDLAKDRRGLRIAKDDMAQFSRAVERDFNDLAARYYLNLCGDPKIRVSRDRITVTFDLAKEE